MKTVNDILREMRKDIPRVVDAKVILRNYADRLEAAYKREFDEAARALDKLTEGICSHCDMQIDCAEGEDGMPTMCNAMCGVRKFIEEHKMEENNEFPF